MVGKITSRYNRAFVLLCKSTYCTIIALVDEILSTSGTVIIVIVDKDAANHVVLENNATEAGFFGLKNSNRDFSKESSWGKNQFNSSFPAALCCYMNSLGYKANYLHIKDKKFQVGSITVESLFGINPTDPNIYFGFEKVYLPYKKYITGDMPRTDLVVSKASEQTEQTVGLEIKLTAIPDNTTKSLSEDQYAPEIVVRPDTIVYLACALAQDNAELLKTLFTKDTQLVNRKDRTYVLENYDACLEKLRKLLLNAEAVQHPIILQPVWKTEGNSAVLAANCFDVFAWSSLGFLYFITENGKKAKQGVISRPMRTVLWLYCMLEDISLAGKTNYSHIIDSLSFSTKNDKAFAAAGTVTREYLACDNLTKPRLTKESIGSIILGQGQDFLRPERRLDAMIVNSPEVFRHESS